MGDMDDEKLLAVIYRGRPATIEEVASLAHLDQGEAAAAIERLRARGLIGGQGNNLGYPHPATWAAETVAAHSADLRRTARIVLGDMERIVADLPGMLRHWSVGESSADLVPVLVRHGPQASEDLWFDTARHDAGALHAVLPDLGRFLATGDDREERIERFAHALAGKETVRVIMPTSALDDPAAVESIRMYATVGVECRLLDDPPSWFWIDSDQLAVPFEWGEGRPTSVLAVRNSALAAMALDYFEGLWRHADPVTPPGHSWTPLLRLMRQGITQETAARMLGINPRTGRRRIAAAMVHYEVSTLFALGVAWASEEDRRR
ncbi:hypothetical protein ACTJI8_06000 [Microbacterium sp. 22303]|uniref:hypothetical protein n=1 Tax=Microbacterium sp. 22303 TaxID=3453905 RepID=UPI003F8466BF